jgi:hypothetical protein
VGVEGGQFEFKHTITMSLSGARRVKPFGCSLRRVSAEVGKLVPNCQTMNRSGIMWELLPRLRLWCVLLLVVSFSHRARY